MFSSFILNRSFLSNKQVEQFTFFQLISWKVGRWPRSWNSLRTETLYLYSRIEMNSSSGNVFDISLCWASDSCISDCIKINLTIIWALFCTLLESKFSFQRKIVSSILRKFHWKMWCYFGGIWEGSFHNYVCRMN